LWAKTKPPLLITGVLFINRKEENDASNHGSDRL
jgi:hypothetical protein